MDGLQECQTPSKRLKAILPVPKWQKQMTEIEAGSHCYELPDTDAFQSIQTFRGGSWKSPKWMAVWQSRSLRLQEPLSGAAVVAQPGLFNWTAVLVRGPWNESGIIQI